ncbi:sensor domain-containing protein [Bacillus solitudinis]|uniref:sensor domain-containing protein n=1 Tax=Bacillus solitudinis TaxID=2014074 RepID=UPI000C246254|nr:GGDEF and EAL domain-containing protein [Bacillus solitudinis]
MNASFSRFAKSKENVLKLLNYMNDGLMITNQAKEIIAVNPSFTKMTGYSFAEVEGKNPKFLQSGQTSRTTFEEMWMSIRESGTWTGEIINRRKDNSKFYCYITVTEIRQKEPEERYYIAIMRDITERKLNEEKMHQFAYYDTLTGLPNRNYFFQELKLEIAKAKEKEEILALLFFDLDRFKKVNDSYGHQAGDGLLSDMAERISEVIDGIGFVSRFGGDEFTVCLPNIKEKSMVKGIVEQIFKIFQAPFMIKGNSIFMTMSIGVSFFPDHGTDADTLLKNADSAMYRTKDEGRNHFRIYEMHMNDQTAEQLTLEGDYLLALQTGQFEVYYQIQIDVDGRTPFGMEALVRWNHPDKGILSPSIFIPIAEDTGTMAELDEWVLKRACHQTRRWQEEGLANLVISVNVSKSFFKQPDFIVRVETALTLSGLAPESLCLEVTENTAILQFEDVRNKLWKLKEKGMRISLDDFGTGYSSLSQLRYFPIDTLKIDQTFVRGSKVKENEAIVKLIIAMAESLNMNVICEGVETEEQLNLVKKEGCRQVQGFLFSLPLPTDKCGELLKKLTNSRNIV